MAQDHRKAGKNLAARMKALDPATLAKRLLSKDIGDTQTVPNSARLDSESISRRRNFFNAPDETWSQLDTYPAADTYSGNIENFVGQVSLPVGLAGPLFVRGLHADNAYPIPLATTEAALVASYNRGCQALNDAGGARALLLSESVSRVPGFVFENAVEAGRFCLWINDQFDNLQAAAQATSNFCRMNFMRLTVEGNHVYLHFDFTTGDAAGQNMVTIASEAACQWIAENSPVSILRWYVEANLSGDKKASMAAFLGVRGKKVTAEVTLPEETIKLRLRTTPEAMRDYWRMSALGGVMSGTIGVQGHYANGLAALFIATGQDAACVSEASVGVTRMEVQAETGALYACVTLPNLILGTVGGGTSLPTQSACLKLMGLDGPGKAHAFAEVVGAVCLAGELSIIAALAAGHFTRAHQKRARS